MKPEGKYSEYWQVMEKLKISTKIGVTEVSFR